MRWPGPERDPGAAPLGQHRSHDLKQAHRSKTLSVLELARRLFFTSALLLFGGVAISVITRDQWLTIAHAVSLVAAVVAALAVLLLLVEGLRRIGATRAEGVTSDGDTSHKQGQVGLD
jgi:hypothetical protein